MTTNVYLIKEGYENLKKHGSKTFSTMLIICATMLITGIFIILLQNVNKNVEVVKYEQGLQAIISDTATDEDIEYMKDQLSKIDGIRDINYINKEMAYKDAEEEFKDMSYFLEGLDKINPFPASFVIRFTDINYADTVKAEVEKIDGITKIKYNSDTINAVISISKIVNIFLLGVGAVMLVVSIFIISNTIKLAVYSNKREIFIMRYIGATNSFILISIGYMLIYMNVPEVGSSIGVFGVLSYKELWYQVLLIYIVLGLFIGIIGSNISIKKYLKV